MKADFQSERQRTEDKVKRIVRQFRLRWKRVGCPEKRKLYWSERAAQRRIDLMGPEPWKALGKDPDDRMCCDGHMCGCGGQTWREHLLDRGDMPPLEYTMIESRKVTQGDWEPNDGLQRPKTR